MPTAAYCYLDESGTCENGGTFVVGIVITGKNKDELHTLCRAIERDSGKGSKKWTDANYSRKLDYIQRIIDTPEFCGRLMYGLFRNTDQYDECKLRTIAAGLKQVNGGLHDAAVIIDGWPKELEDYAKLRLRELEVHPKKVRGGNEKNDELLRLADALCGLIHVSIRGNPETSKILQTAQGSGIIGQLVNL
jgi:hypothetical protein